MSSWKSGRKSRFRLGFLIARSHVTNHSHQTRDSLCSQLVHWWTSKPTCHSIRSLGCADGQRINFHKYHLIEQLTTTVSGTNAAEIFSAVGHQGSKSNLVGRRNPASSIKAMASLKLRHGLIHVTPTSTPPRTPHRDLAHLSAELEMTHSK